MDFISKLQRVYMNQQPFKMGGGRGEIKDFVISSAFSLSCCRLKNRRPICV